MIFLMQKSDFNEGVADSLNYNRLLMIMTHF